MDYLFPFVALMLLVAQQGQSNDAAMNDGAEGPLPEFALLFGVKRVLQDRAAKYSTASQHC